MGADEVVIQVNDSANAAPVVDAGEDQAIVMPDNTLRLNGTASDDGTPAGSLQVQWRQVNGPGQVTFEGFGSNAEVLSPVASFPEVGDYVLRLTVSDGVLTNADDISVTVALPENMAPVVDAGPTQVVRAGEVFTPDAFAWDDGLPLGSSLLVSWSKVSGPGGILCEPGGTNFSRVLRPSMVFEKLGTYALRLTADDGERHASSDLQVEVEAAEENEPPTVEAGADRTVVASRPVLLDGWIDDDGLPQPATLYAVWSALSGPGPVHFSQAGAPATTATFYTPGTYQLRLAATDGRWTAADEVAFTVIAPTNAVPVVFAGPDLEVTRPAAAQLFGTVLDDGLPWGGTVTASWSQLNGPGQATFGPSPDALSASVIFDQAGLYTLRLSASDTEFTATDDVVVRVKEGTNSPPAVDAGPAVAIALPAEAVLSGEASDDGLPAGTLQVEWEKVSGPGAVSFSTLNGIYRASFVEAGDLRAPVDCQRRRVDGF